MATERHEKRAWEMTGMPREGSCSARLVALHPLGAFRCFSLKALYFEELPPACPGIIARRQHLQSEQHTRCCGGGEVSSFVDSCCLYLILFAWGASRMDALV